MKTFYLCTESHDEVFKNLMDFLDSITDEGQIYINSSGGSTWFFDSLLTRIEEVNKIHPITLRGLFLGSKAFDLFYDYTGKKILEKDCDAVVHTLASEYHFFKYNGNIEMRADHIDKQRFASTKQTEPYTFLTPEEQAKFINGEDIYLSYDRLQSIFAKQ